MCLGVFLCVCFYVCVCVFMCICICVFVAVSIWASREPSTPLITIKLIPTTDQIHNFLTARINDIEQSAPSQVVSFSYGPCHRSWELLKTFSSNNFQKEQPSISCKSSVLQNLELRAFKFTDRRFQIQTQTHRWADMSWIFFRPGASLKITVIRCEDETFWNIATHYRAILDNLSLSLLYSSYQMLLKMKNSQFWSTDSSLSVSNIWQTSIENCGGDYFRKWIASTSVPEIWWSIVFRYSQQQQHLTR